jgi:hypothetical protein
MGLEQNLFMYYGVESKLVVLEVREQISLCAMGQTTETDYAYGPGSRICL